MCPDGFDELNGSPFQHDGIVIAEANPLGQAVKPDGKPTAFMSGW
jgi:hypothetical protein